MKDDFWETLGVMDENLDGEIDLTDYFLEDDFEREMALMEEEEKKSHHSHHEDLGEEYDEEFSDDDIDYEEFSDGLYGSESTDQEQEEPPKRKKPIDAKQYCDEDYESWDFKQALIDNFTELAEDYEDNHDADLRTIICDTYYDDKERCVKYLKWLWTFFPSSIFSKPKPSSYKNPAYETRGQLICSLIINYTNDDYLYQLCKTDSDFINAAFKGYIHDKHNYSLVERYIKLMLAHNDFDSALKMYNEYLIGQKDRYTQRDLGNLWLSIVTSMKYMDNFENEDIIKTYDKILPVLDAIDPYGKKAITEIKEFKTKYEEEEKRWAEMTKEDEERLAEKKAEEEKRLAEEKKATALSYIINTLGETIHNLVSLGEYFQEDIVEDKTFELCFSASNHRYDKVCEKLLSAYGKITPLGDGILKGIIPANKLSEIYMLLFTTGEMANYFVYKYNLFKQTEALLTAAKINEPIVNYIASHNRFAKLLELEHKAKSIEVSYYEHPMLLMSHRIWRDSECNERDKSSKMFEDFVAAGEIKSKFIFEKQMFMLIREKYPDTLFKYSPDWLYMQKLTVYIPSIKVAFEYQEQPHENAVEPKKNNSDLESQPYYQMKKEKCQSRGITMIKWSFEEPFEEAVLLEKLKSVQK